VLAPDVSPSVETLASVPAVALFVERAQASAPAFALTADNAPAVARLCAHLDDLPLALELAAAHANVLTPAQLLGWLEHRLPALSWHAPDLPARQPSLHAALAWSYALLPEAEQALFRRLAVFAGGWTPEAAETVTHATGLGLDAVDGLARLVDASLVQVSRPADECACFSMLATVRAFAAEQLAASGERAEIERRHAAYCVALAEQADLARRWRACGDLHETRAVLEGALARRPGRRAGLRLKVLQGAGLAASASGDYGTATARLEQVLELARRLGNDPDLVATPATVGLLSPREQEVLPLVTEGLTNKEIAERLVISASTAKYHLTSLLNKLGADNRTQAVAHATQQGLL